MNFQLIWNQMSNVEGELLFLNRQLVITMPVLPNCAGPSAGTELA